ncbi:hypothetical protein M9Y10_036002 [Tritrichomonas musculus]|uniref:Protein kinase domain-containing protein n=1 Tax=Tritrichomonas musculus TaxID=1915356 RepID=A0ABR2GXE7_9EUKA
MQEVSFKNIPQEYDANINDVQDKVIKTIYNKFIFKYLKYFTAKETIIEADGNNHKNQFEMFLFNYLKSFKFIVFNYLSDLKEINSGKCDVVICVEGYCLIVEQIHLSMFNNIISNLKDHHISIINVTSGISENEMVDDEERKASEEVNNLYSKLSSKIKTKEFFKNTFYSIAGFLIRRYFFPTEYFKDPSFFNFRGNNKENLIKSEFIRCINSADSDPKDVEKIKNKIRSNENNNEPNLREFNEKEFVILRNIYSKENSSLLLVIHLDSLYLFMMKKLIFPDQQNKEKEHEICFNEKYSHRCLTPFYGFLKNNKGKIIGFIYEFMSNGSLKTLIQKNNEKTNEAFSLITINRILQGIDYLHSNSLIHRDLKPSNILIDHDYIPYISDFETVRAIDENDESQEMTNNIGSYLYSSPEQYEGSKVSFPTDIYSFGLIIYYLYAKENMLENNGSEMTDLKYRNILHLPNDIENIEKIESIYQKCVQYKAEERFTIKEIKSLLIIELDSFIINNLLLSDDRPQIFHFIYENFIFHVLNQEICEKSNFDLLMKFNNILDNSDLYNLIGTLFEHGVGMNKNYLKAKKYYEISAKRNNSRALLNLGNLYFKGNGVEQNYSKAKKYYELSSELNNSEALNNLGYIYFGGYGVSQDYLKAKEFFEQSAKKGCSCAYCNLGKLYLKGYGVEKDYFKAKEYFEMSAEQKNSDAFFNLGNIYHYGYGVKQDYSKAVTYYELSGKQKNPNALNSLGKYYYYGIAVNKNYEKAFEYFKQSAEHKKAEALLFLCILYKNGVGVKQDFIKAKECYRLLIEQNNLSFTDLSILLIKFM